MELKNCPICGAKAFDINPKIAKCSDINCILGNNVAPLMHHSVWNTRTPSPSADKLIAALEFYAENNGYSVEVATEALAAYQKESE